MLKKYFRIKIINFAWITKEFIHALFCMSQAAKNRIRMIVFRSLLIIHSLIFLKSHAFL